MSEPAAAQRIEQAIREHPVVLFMKGSRSAPQCGFSAQAVELLEQYLERFETIDVLEDPAVRDAIKRRSDWPTIPQLYVMGEFVGGADILAELDRTGELIALLGELVAPVRAPALSLTPAAAAAIRAALDDEADARDDGDEAAPAPSALRLKIDARYYNDLSLGAKRPGDLELAVAGIPVVVDRATARRADGVVIDYVDDPSGEGTGFRIDNPNAPPPVRALDVKSLAARLAEARAAGQVAWLIDVRTPEEQRLARIEGARLLDEDLLAELEALPRDTPLYLHCHHGGRSARAAEHLRERGFRAVYNVTGGIDAWSEQVDPSVPRY